MCRLTESCTVVKEFYNSAHSETWGPKNFFGPPSVWVYPPTSLTRRCAVVCAPRSDGGLHCLLCDELHRGAVCASSRDVVRVVVTQSHCLLLITLRTGCVVPRAARHSGVGVPTTYASRGAVSTVPVMRAISSCLRAARSDTSTLNDAALLVD